MLVLDTDILIDVQRGHTAALAWFTPDDLDSLRRWLADPDPTLLDHNEALARRHFGMDALVHRLDLLLSGSPMCHHSGAQGEGELTGCDCLTV